MKLKDSFYKNFIINLSLSFLIILFFIGTRCTQPPDDVKHEGRALWVTVFDPIYSYEEIESLVNKAVSYGYNTLLFQVRFRGDTLYIPNRNDSTYKNTEPPSTYLKKPLSSFDPLQTAIDIGHEKGLEIHAYVNYGVVTGSYAPTNPNHVYNKHPEYITYMYNPSTGEHRPMEPSESDGAYIDPGVLEANEYTKNVFMDIIVNYDIDGIHFDHIRYPDTPWKRPYDWGYNPKAIERFNAENGRTGFPNPNDETWIKWKQDQVTQFVRDMYKEATSLKPWIKISGALIGRSLNDAVYYTYQNWPAWYEEGIIDIGIPMIYTTDTSKAVSLMEQFMPLKKDRIMYMGLRAYNTNDGSYTSEQIIEKIQAAQDMKADGITLFRYGSALSEGYLDDIYESGVFEEPAKPSDTPFKAGFDEVPPNAVKSFSAKLLLNGDIQLEWNIPKKASDGDLPAKYQIYHSMNPSVNTFRYENLLVTLNGTSRKYIDKPEKYGTHYYKIIAIDDYNNRSEDSEEVSVNQGPSVSDIIIESRDSSGLLTPPPLYEESSGWADSTSKSTAEGLSGQGSRYTSDTYLTSYATFTPLFLQKGRYEVFTTFGTSGNAYNVKYIIKHSEGSSEVFIDQDGWGGSGESNANKWISLGTYLFSEGQNKELGSVTVDESSVTGKPSKNNNGRTYSDAVKFVFVGP